MKIEFSTYAIQSIKNKMCNYIIKKEDFYNKNCEYIEDNDFEYFDIEENKNFENELIRILNNTKLNVKDKIIVSKYFVDNFKQKEIALKYKTTPQNIARIIKRFRKVCKKNDVIKEINNG